MVLTPFFPLFLELWGTHNQQELTPPHPGKIPKKWANGQYKEAQPCWNMPLTSILGLITWSYLTLILKQYLNSESVHPSSFQMSRPKQHLKQGLQELQLSSARASTNICCQKPDKAGSEQPEHLGKKWAATDKLATDLTFGGLFPTFGFVSFQCNSGCRRPQFLKTKCLCSFSS